MCCCLFCRLSNGISTNGSNLAAAINALSYLGITVNGDRCIATHQGRVAMCAQALTGTEYATLDIRRTCSTDRVANRHCRAFLYSTNLTAAIDVTSCCAVAYSTVTDSYIGATGHHGFATPEGVGFALTAAEYITGNLNPLGTFCDSFVIYNFRC